MPLRPSPAASHRTAAQAGLSLVELLVVLGIIAAMAGLVLGGLFRSRDGNRLLAAEQVLADAIRQGRHTARSTGAPVELRLTPLLSGTEVIGARLAGTSQTVLWSETFDKVRDVNDDGVIDSIDEAKAPSYTDGSDGVVIGRSGNGRIASKEHPITHELTRGDVLVRGGRTDGFYLACSVLPPINIARGAVLPLVVVGDAQGEEKFSQCALFLAAHFLYIEGTPPPPPKIPPVPPGPFTAEVPLWVLSGSVWDANGIETAVNSLEDPATTRMANVPLPSAKPDPAHAISGGQWIDVGLLYDGKRLILYQDGQRVAELRTDVPPTMKVAGNHVHVGMVHRQVDPEPIYAPMPIDDVRISRLGTADISTLPGNVVLVSAAGASPDAGLKWRILCHPDGRVEVHRDDDSDIRSLNDRAGKWAIEPFTDKNGNQKTRVKSRTGDTATIMLGQLSSPGTIQNAELTIMLDGRVRSRLVTAAVPGATE